MKKILSYSLMLVSLITSLMCSSPEDIIPPTSSEDTTITDAERMEVFEACKKKSVELNNLETTEDRITFLAWLATQPAFYSYGFAGEDLYAIFVDGRIVLFLNTPLGEDIGGRTVTGGRSSCQDRSNNSTGRTEDLPKAKKVSLFTGMGVLFPDNVGALKSIFAKADAGYQVEIKEATVANLKAVAGDAVFYINTHGGAGQLHTRYGPRGIMALWTTELVTPARDVSYKEELDEERMCYAFSTYHTEADEFHYAITASFIREYMSFGENCLIYLDACNGMDERVTGNATFRERMIAQATNESATIAGWTGVTYSGVAGRTSQFVFDRLLGANSGGNISQEHPFQRPFDIAQVFADMRSEGLGVAQNGAQLIYKTTVEEEVLIRPTIESMEVDEYTSTLIIKGLFGRDRGNVKVNDVTAVVISWTPYAISCTIRETGDGSVGDVVVVSPEGVKSNPVPLTEYIIKLNYSADDNGIKFAGVAELRLRADVHPRRAKIYEPPTKPTYEDHSPSSGFIFNVAGSSAVYTVTGRKYETCNIQNCHLQFTESPTPKVGRLSYTLSNTAPSQFFAMYNWGPEQTFIKINIIYLSVPGIPLTFEERMQCQNVPEIVIPAEGEYSAWFGFPSNELESSFSIQIAENYNMRPDTWTKTINRTANNCDTVGLFKQVIQWDVIVPKHAPTENTSSRMANEDGE